MPAHPARLLRHLRPPAPDADADLLGRFVRDRDEAAFAALVRRHGPMVHGVCRRAVADPGLVDDAFQATFLVLARRAAVIRSRESLAAWLHGVAYRVARKARVAAARRRLRESPAAGPEPLDRHPDPLAEVSARELLAVVDEEVRGLPEAYRLPVILCCLEGKTQEEAARHLGWTPGSVRGRLERGRARLHVRLARRGLTLAAALAAVEVARGRGVAGALAEITVRLAGGRGADGTEVSGTVALLAREGLRESAGSRLRAATLLLVLATGLAAAAAGVLSRSGPDPAPPATPPPAAQGRTEPARTDRFGDPLPAGALARLGTLRFRNGDSVEQIAFTPDGKALAAACSFGGLHLWECGTGREITPAGGFADAGDAVALSPDGRVLAAGSPGGITLFDTASGKPRLHFGPPRRVIVLAFSPDGRLLASVDQDNTVALWEAATGRALHTFDGPKHHLRSSVSFSADSRTLAIGTTKDGDIRIRDTATGAELRRFAAHERSVYALAFAPDGRALASLEAHGKLCLWDPRTWKEIAQAATEDWYTTLAFSPDGQTLALGGSGVSLWDVRTLRRTVRLEEARGSGGVEFLAFAPDGKTLAASCDNNRVVLFWDTTTGRRRWQYDGFEGDVWGLAFAPDGRTIASGARERNNAPVNAVRRWEPFTGRELRPLGERLGHVEAVAYSPDGRTLAAANEDGTIPVWDVATGREVLRLKGHEGSVQSLAFSADGALLASRGADKAICLWDMRGGKRLVRFRTGPDDYARIALSPDGKTVAEVGDMSGLVRLWDAAAGTERRRLEGHARGILGVAFSPDGRTLAAPGVAAPIVLWDVATGAARRRLEGPAGGADFIAFSPDGRLLASGAPDRAVRVWEAATGAEWCRFAGHGGIVLAGAFSPDGRLLVTGGTDSTGLVWDVTGRMRGGRLEAFRPHPGEVDGYWADLEAGDGRRVHRAVWALVAAAEESAPFLKDRLRVPAPPDAGRVGKLIAGLDSDRFDERESAARELARLGLAAEPALVKALAAASSPEARRRLGRLLEGLDTARLRQARAVAVLEWCGTPAARQALEELARGAPEARLTQEAKASLGRLARRPAPSP